MENTYRNYTFETFLEDDFFRESVYNPSPESEHFWQDLLEKGLINQLEYEQARELLLELMQTGELPLKIKQRLPFIWTRIQKTNQKGILHRIFHQKHLFRYAASIALIVATTLSYLVLKDKFSENNIDYFARTAISQVEKEKLSDEIVLVRDKHSFTITGDSAFIDYSKDKALIINNEKVDDTEGTSSYNQLVVPYGKRSFVTLSDGTKIWVNAGTRIIYPVTFNNKFREIYVDGEIYADIAPDKSCPFILKTKEMDIRVLGTELNITAYEADSTRQVILVEGAVQIHNRTGDKKTLDLTPNQRFYATNYASRVQQVDVSYYISWKDGYYLFKDEYLSSILHKVSRYYGIKIIFDNSLPDVICSGGLDMKENIERVLAGICESTPVTYELKDNIYVFSMNK